jgi:hypothetical protein
MPAQAGIHLLAPCRLNGNDSGLRRNDVVTFKAIQPYFIMP